MSLSETKSTLNPDQNLVLDVVAVGALVHGCDLARNPAGESGDFEDSHEEGVCFCLLVCCVCPRVCRGQLSVLLRALGEGVAFIVVVVLVDVGVGVGHGVDVGFSFTGVARLHVSVSVSSPVLHCTDSDRPSSLRQLRAAGRLGAGTWEWAVTEGLGSRMAGLSGADLAGIVWGASANAIQQALDSGHCSLIAPTADRVELFARE
eukprot:297317-Rhodomonas_salina.1